MNDESVKLKHFQDALAGRVLSGIAAHEINVALCGDGPYRHYCEQGEKLPGIYKERLHTIADAMVARGVVPSASLLTEHQRRAIERRKQG